MDYLGINIGCVTGSLRDGKFPEKDCLLPLLSKVLGYLIVALSTTVKLPQVTVPPSLLSLIFHMKLIHRSSTGEIRSATSTLLLFSLLLFLFTVVQLQILKILKHRSASGISATTFELEVVAATIGLGYSIQKGIPFSAYGEVFFILIQGKCYIILVLFFCVDSLFQVCEIVFPKCREYELLNK